MILGEANAREWQQGATLRRCALCKRTGLMVPFDPAWVTSQHDEERVAHTTCAEEQYAGVEGDF